MKKDQILRGKSLTYSQVSWRLIAGILGTISLVNINSIGAEIRAAGGNSNPIIRGSGIDAPGAPEGASFFTLNHAFINNNGEVLVEANLTGGPATENLGLWSNGGGGSLRLVALESTATTGTDFAGTNYKSFAHIALNNTGLVAASLTVKDGGSSSANDFGVFGEHGTGTFTGTMREGSPAPDAGAGAFTILQPPVVAETLIAFPGQLKINAGTGVTALNDRGIWTTDGTTDNLFVREGDPVVAAGAPTGITYASFNTRMVATNDNTIAFSGLVNGNGDDKRMLFAGQPGNLRLIATRNDRIQGLEMSRFDSESLNEAGDVAFRALLIGLPSHSNMGLFTNINGVSRSVAREGQQAPGQPPGVLFDRFTDLHLVDGGDLVFFVYLQGTDVSSTSDAAIYRFSEAAGTLTPVVREGDLALGTDGSVITSIHGFDVNRSGGIVYIGTLQIGFGDTTSSNNLGLWLSPDSTPPVLVARRGDEFVYAPGNKQHGPDIRTISNLSIDRVSNAPGGVGSTPKVLNDSGQAIIKVDNNLGGGAFLVGGGEIPKDN